MHQHPTTLILIRSISMSIYTVPCLHCKTEYPYRSNKKFCCRKCKQLNKEFPYRRFKKDVCEDCGFVPVYKCQLDVDHVDGNRHNNSPDNLRTICANCHRLKTYLNNESCNLKTRAKKRDSELESL